MATYTPELRRPLRASRADARDRLRGLVRGRPADPRWVRPSLIAILVLAASLMVWDLAVTGYGNTYYAAAVKSGSVSWKAMFFGSLDPGSFITVDKPPLSLWLMSLSARIFGFSTTSMMLPEVLCTVAAVGLLFTTVRRAFGPAAGLIAAGALALTPITVAMARSNMPDALLVLLLVASAALLMRALESGRTKHLAWCGVVVGLAFMTKMLQGWMIAPALFGTYLLAGQPRLAVRVRQLCVMAGTMVVASAAWPVAVSIWPGSTPYIGGSANGSVWNLIFGYNGFGRITGSESGPGGGGGPNFGGQSGLWRMFNAQVGGQVAWLLPLALVSLVAGLWLTRRAPRTDRARAAWILLGLWAIVHAGVFSTQKGIFHPYYVSALAPAVAALSGAGLVTLWRHARTSWVALAVLDAAVIGTAVLAVSLLGRTADHASWLRVAIPILAGTAVLGSLAIRGGVPRRVVGVIAACGLAAMLAGPASYSLATVQRSLGGGNVLAGPASAAQAGGMGGGPGGGGGFRGGPPSGGSPQGGSFAGGPPSGTAAAAGGTAGGPPAGTARAGSSAGGSAASGASPSATGGRPSFGGGGMDGASIDKTLVAYLEAHLGSAEYLVAATGSQTTASIIIATGKPVVTIGGFNGSDPAPTLSQFQSLVKSGKLRYVLVGGGMGGGPGGGGGTSASLTQWITAHGKAVSGITTTSGTLYDLSGAA